MALEPRIMFDAAAVATAVAVLDANHDATASTAPKTTVADSHGGDGGLLNDLAKAFSSPVPDTSTPATPGTEVASTDATGSTANIKTDVSSGITGATGNGSSSVIPSGTATPGTEVASTDATGSTANIKTDVSSGITGATGNGSSSVIPSGTATPGTEVASTDATGSTANIKTDVSSGITGATGNDTSSVIPSGTATPGTEVASTDATGSTANIKTDVSSGITGATGNGSSSVIPSGTGASIPEGGSLVSDTRTPATPGTEVAFVDPRVQDVQILMDGMRPDVRIVSLAPDQDGVRQMTDDLSAHPGTSAVHILSHGTPGDLYIGSTSLTAETIDSYAAEFQTWKNFLTPDADILLYGCDIAAGPGGNALLNQLAALTGADIAASTDATGSAAKGGDWVLEQQTGQIDSRLAVSEAALANYDGLLVATTNVVPGAQTVAEDNTLTFANTISVTTTATNVNVQISIAHGSLTLSGTAGLAFTVGDGTSDPAMTFSGTTANVNNALNGLVYRPTANYSGADTLTIVSNDTTTPGNTDTDTVGITVTPNATAPVLTLPITAQTVQEDVATYLDFTGTNAITLTDADANDLQTLTLSVANGTLNLKTNVAGGITSATGNGTSSVILSGTAAQLSTTLADTQGVQYTSNLNYNSSGGPAEALSFNLNDGQHTQSGSVSLNVTPVNDAPTVSGGIPLSVAEGGTASFSAAVTAGSGFTQAQLGLADVDNSSAQTIVKIAGLPAHGSLKLSGNPVAVGSTFSVADISNFSYTHDGSQVTSVTADTFNLTFDDGAGGLLVNQPVSVTLTPVNQPPSVSGNITVIEGETGVRLDLNGALPTLGTARGAISVSDPEGAAISTYNITSLPANGTLFYNGTPIASASPGSPFVVRHNPAHLQP